MPTITKSIDQIPGPIFFGELARLAVQPLWQVIGPPFKALAVCLLYRSLQNYKHPENLSKDLDLQIGSGLKPIIDGGRIKGFQLAYLVLSQGRVAVQLRAIAGYGDTPKVVAVRNLRRVDCLKLALNGENFQKIVDRIYSE
jgi:hypothetical protein